jgi:serine/threonine protein kinase/predicted anti-sigma-YlaC factor YlaD
MIEQEHAGQVSIKDIDSIEITPMRNRSNCPQVDRLKRLMAGSLSQIRQRVVERHLESCQPCQTYLEKLVYDAEGSVRPISCPARSVLKRLVEGTLASAAQEAIENHLETCNECSALYEAMGEGECFKFPPVPCPSRSVLALLLGGSLSPREQEVIEHHLEGCEPCQARLDALACGDEAWPSEVRNLRRQQAASAPGLKRVIGILKDEVARDPEATGYVYAQANSNEMLALLDPPDAAGDLGKLGPYRILQLLGQGCMGTVLKAFDPALSRTVAIKVLAPQLAASSSARQRFAREARAAAAIRDDHVVAIHSVDEWKGLPYLVMEFIPGGSLQERLDRSAPLDANSILRIGMQAAFGLAAAHAQGLVHRDVKPSNILLENCVDRVKISDFSLARAVDDASLTQSGVVAGTPLYMAPEQARCETIDHRADLFSLGAVLYVMCTGRSPFRAPTTLGVLRRVCDDAHRPVREVNPDIPEWLAAIVDRLLAKDREVRFQTAGEVASILENHLSRRQRGIDDDVTGLSPQRSALVEEVGPPKQPERRRTLWKTLGYVLVVLAGLFVLAAVLRITHMGEDRPADVVSRFFPQGTQLAIFNPYREIEVLIDGTPVGKGSDGILSSFRPFTPSCVVDVYRGRQRIEHKVIALRPGMTVECEISQDGELRIMHEGPVRDPRPWWRWRRENLFGQQEHAPRGNQVEGGDGRLEPDSTTRSSLLARLNLANVDREEQKAAVERAKVLRDSAESALLARRREFQYIAKLATANSVPVGEVEKGQGRVIAATKDLEAAKAGVIEAEAVLREAELRSAEAQAQLDSASGHESDPGVQETIREYPRRRAENEVARTTAQLARIKTLYDKAIALIEHEKKQLARLTKLRDGGEISPSDVNRPADRVRDLERERDLTKIEVSRAETQLKSAQEALRSLIGRQVPRIAEPARPSAADIELMQAEVALKSSKAAHEQRSKELQRTKTLYDQRSVSRADMDEAERNAAVAYAEERAAEAHVAELKAQTKAREIESRQAHEAAYSTKLPDRDPFDPNLAASLQKSSALARLQLEAARDIAAARAARVRATLQKDVAECKYLGKQHERLKQLQQSRFVAAQEVESAEAALATADARRRLTQSDLEHAEREFRAAEERASRPQREGKDGSK